MTQPLFPSTIGTQSHSAKFLTMKTVVRKNQTNNGHAGSQCSDRRCLRKGGYVLPSTLLIPMNRVG